MNRSLLCCLRETRRLRSFSSFSLSQNRQIILATKSNHNRRTLFLRQNSASKIAIRWQSTEEKKDEKEETPISIWTQLQSPPNMITLTRVASTPLLAYWIVSENYTLAIWGCSLAAISDYLDGYLAKRYGWSTVVGSYLDPIADKIFINTIGLSLWYSGILPTPLVAVWATKDVGLLSATAWNVYQKHNSINIFATSLAQKPLKVTPTTIAKVNTALQFATLGVGIVTPVMISMPPVILDSLW
jgi:cardiolipin synthase